MVRLQKFLADAGICSRRKAEELILSGKVIVNDKIVKELGTKIDEKDDVVKYKGKHVTIKESKVYVMLNKPVGYMCTSDDELDRSTVLELVKGVRTRVFPVGRLDCNTSGLLLLTNDGELTFKLTHPKHEVDKCYIAKVRGSVEESDLQKLRDGVMLDGRKTLPAVVNLLDKSEKWSKIEVIIHEGRNRQVRRMCETVGFPIIKLKRASIGKLKLGSLQEGQWRHLLISEVEYLKKL